MKFLILTILLALAFTSLADAQTIEKKALTLEGAKKAAAAAVAEAKRINAPGGSVAVVDDGGHLVAMERLDNTFAAAANISIGKARTAAIFGRPTKVFEDIINKGRTSMTTLPDFTPLQGGVPLVAGGRVVGAIGVSGAASAQQDEELAIAGAAALAGVTNPTKNSAPKVSYFPAPQVKNAFEKGMSLLEVANYKVHASHRDEPGIVEIHEKDTDIIYMLEGSATLVTGGAVVDSKMIEPEEIRGSNVQGGQSRRISKGDVIIIPHGTPHWFKEVNGPINYYVVKVRSAD
jgi:glc operon protein GlcG